MCYNKLLVSEGGTPYLENLQVDSFEAAPMNLLRLLHPRHELSLLLAKRNGLTVGKNFFWGLGSKIDQGFCHLITIGDNVTFAGGGGVTVIVHDASSVLFMSHSRIGKVNIGNRVYIGGGTVILPGVTIGDDVVIGARSLVSKDIPSRSVAYGVPVKVIETIDDFIARRKKEMETYPYFGKEYAAKGRVDSDLRREMCEKIKDRYGFV